MPAHKGEGRPGRAKRKVNQAALIVARNPYLRVDTVVIASGRKEISCPIG